MKRYPGFKLCFFKCDNLCRYTAANMINFMFCPPAYRVLYLNAGGLFWNAFLSFQNAKSNAVAATATGTAVMAAAKEA
jgi:hypothetical protein